METNKFEIHAIVELFGHSRIAGKVTEQSIGGATFIRVDVPDTKTQPPFTRFLNPSAIYAINPVTEEVAISMANSIQSKPIQLWDVEEVVNRINSLKKEPAQVSAGNGPEDEEDEEELEDDDYRTNE